MARSPAALTRLGVTAVVNCAFNSEPLPPNVRAAAGVSFYARLDLRDVAAHAGQDCEALIRAGAAEVAAAGGATGGGVLVHCVAGMSRSAAVVVAYLVLHGGRSLVEAMGEVKTARPAAHPNAGFWEALRRIEVGVGGVGGSSVPEGAVEALHEGERFPVSTHVFGDAERS